MVTALSLTKRYKHLSLDIFQTYYSYTRLKKLEWRGKIPRHSNLESENDESSKYGNKGNFPSPLLNICLPANNTMNVAFSR